MKTNILKAISQCFDEATSFWQNPAKLPTWTYEDEEHMVRRYAVGLRKFCTAVANGELDTHM